MEKTIWGKKPCLQIMSQVLYGSGECLMVLQVLCWFRKVFYCSQGDGNPGSDGRPGDDGITRDAITRDAMIARDAIITWAAIRTWNAIPRGIIKNFAKPKEHSQNHKTLYGTMKHLFSIV